MSSKQISSVLDGPGSAEEKLSAIRSLVAEASSGKSREKIATMSSEVRDDNPYRYTATAAAAAHNHSHKTATAV